MKYILLLGVLLFSLAAHCDNLKKDKQNRANAIQFLSPVPYSTVYRNESIKLNVLLGANQKIHSYETYLEKGGLSKLDCGKYFTSPSKGVFTKESLPCNKKKVKLSLTLKVNAIAMPGDYMFRIKLLYDDGNTSHACLHFYVGRR